MDLAEDKQAHNIMLLDISKQTTIAEYFVLCSADNDRQVKAIVDHIDERIHREFDHHPRIEGEIPSGWVILDYASVIVHVFRKDQREYYQLERLWSKATPVIVVQ